jgi:hypothetical protein
MDLDDALAVLAALVGSAGHPEGDPALFVVRRELDAARARVAELDAENERLRVAPQRPARFSDVVGADRAAEYHRVDRAAEDAARLPPPKG